VRAEREGASSVSPDARFAPAGVLSLLSGERTRGIPSSYGPGGIAPRNVRSSFQVSIARRTAACVMATLRSWGSIRSPANGQSASRSDDAKMAKPTDCRYRRSTRIRVDCPAPVSLGNGPSLRRLPWCALPRPRCRLCVPPAAPFKRMRVPLGDRRATVRDFKPETGDTLVHQFRKGEGRELTEAALVQQVRRAGVLGKRNRDFNPQANARHLT
jgi:hypothetical protein